MQFIPEAFVTRNVFRFADIYVSRAHGIPVIIMQCLVAKVGKEFRLVVQVVCLGVALFGITTEGRCPDGEQADP